RVLRCFLALRVLAPVVVCDPGGAGHQLPRSGRDIKRVGREIIQIVGGGRNDEEECCREVERGGGGRGEGGGGRGGEWGRRQGGGWAGGPACWLGVKRR